MLTEELKKGLKDSLSRLGVTEGDILYIASDIKSLLFTLAMKYEAGSKKSRNAALHDLIDIFQQAVGKSGTLLFPVFSWEWCRGNGFNYRQTKGEVGTLSNWVQEHREDFIRTSHPIYSFMVWGKDAEYLKHMDNQDAWSHSSPFYYLHKQRAKQLFFNIEAYQGMTFVHYIEQEVQVPYRHPKYFFGEYTDEQGRTETRMYSMYVRDIDVVCDCAIHNQYLIEKGVAKQEVWEENTLTVVDLEASYPLIRQDMLENSGKNTLAFEEGSLDWSKSRTVPYEVKGMK